ncbi:MAG: GNAT family N-acetyltransferase [Syntrophobacteria bacterium]
MIRPVRPTDFKRLLDIEAKAFPKSQYDLGEFWSLYLRYPESFLVEATDDIEGYIVFSPDGHVISMAVAPRRRRRGVGSRLLGEAIGRCAGSPLYLEVRVSNVGAQQFYECLGFRKSELRPRYYLDGEDAVVMVRPPDQDT